MNPIPLHQMDTAFGMFEFTGSPEMVEVMGLSGMDFVIFDLEHTHYGLENIANRIRAANCVNLRPLVRVAENNKIMIAKALDLGAQGIIIPHVKNKHDAESIVAAVHYPSRGVRPACPAVRAANFGQAWKQYSSNIDNNVSIIALIEDAQAFDNLEEILATPGLDIAFLGPFDLAISADIPVEAGLEHPLMVSYMHKFVEACRRHNVKPMSSLGARVEVRYIQYLLQFGFEIINFSSNLSVFFNTCIELKRMAKTSAGFYNVS